MGLFAGHQAAEKAVKALYQIIHVEAVGNSISRMLRDLSASAKPRDELIERAKEIDKHYIPTVTQTFILKELPWTITLDPTP